MKITLVYNSFPTASETFLLNLAIELSRKGHEVTMIVMSKTTNQSHYDKLYGSYPFNIIENPMQSFWQTIFFLAHRPIRLYRFFSRSRLSSLKKTVADFIRLEIVSEHKPEVVHFAYSSIAIDFIEILPKLSKQTKLFVSCRGSSEIYKPVIEPHRSHMLSLLWQRVHRVHCVSQNMLDRMVNYGLKEENGFVNYPSIDIEKFSYVERSSSLVKSIKNKVTIVSTGRLNHQKGYIYAIHAIKELVSLGVNLEYHILGQGPEYGPLKFAIHDNLLADKIYLHGKVNADFIKSMLTKAHIFLLPSVYEGISNAVLEAMASGVPVITTDAGGMSEVISNAQNGIIIPRYSSTAMTNAIKEMVDNYPKALEYAQKARETVSTKFNIQHQIHVFDQMYSSSCDS